MAPDPLDLAAEIARCDREIAAMESQPPTEPAYLVTMGIEDWRREREQLFARGATWLHCRSLPIDQRCAASTRRFQRPK